MSSKYTILITGVTRGLGLDLLKRYLSRPDHVVIATVRDPKAPAAQALYDLPKGKGSSLIVVKIDSTRREDANDAVKELRSNHGIDHVDLVIANAGMALVLPYLKDLKIDDIAEHMEVNVYGVVRLFQAVLPLLDAAKAPKWVSMGSSAGSFNDMFVMPHPNSAYGASKIVLHFHTLKMHCEHPNVTALVVHPGWVQTDMGNGGAAMLGLEKADITVEESVVPMIALFDAATRETHGGKFWNYDGTQKAW